MLVIWLGAVSSFAQLNAPLKDVSAPDKSTWSEVADTFTNTWKQAKEWGKKQLDKLATPAQTPYPGVHQPQQRSTTVTPAKQNSSDSNARTQDSSVELQKTTPKKEARRDNLLRNTPEKVFYREIRQEMDGTLVESFIPSHISHLDTSFQFPKEISLQNKIRRAIVTQQLEMY